MGLMRIRLQQQLMIVLMEAVNSLLQSGNGGSILPMRPGFGTAGPYGIRQGPLGSFFGGGSGLTSANSPQNDGGSSAIIGSSGQSDDTSFTTLNVNIKSRPAMPQEKVVADVRKAAQHADLIGWNEISLSRYRDAIKNLGPQWGHFMPKDGKYQISNPISYKKDEWKFLDGGFKKTHDGAYGICPDRYITWAKLKHKGSGEKIVRINTHTVAGAFSKGSSHNAWRKSSWNTHMKKLSDLVAKFKKQGFKVIIAGDLNRDNNKVLGNQVTYDNKLNRSTTDGGSQLDYLMHTGGGLRVLNSGVVANFNSDHHAVIGNYNLGGNR